MERRELLRMVRTVVTSCSCPATNAPLREAIRAWLLKGSCTSSSSAISGPVLREGSLGSSFCATFRGTPEA
eukprot:9341418-Alexandrium_andersonii.AAC.1